MSVISEETRSFDFSRFYISVFFFREQRVSDICHHPPWRPSWFFRRRFVVLLKIIRASDPHSPPAYLLNCLVFLMHLLDRFAKIRDFCSVQKLAPKGIAIFNLAQSHMRISFARPDWLTRL